LVAATEKTKEKTANLYEGMFLVDSAKFASDPDGVTTHVLGILERSGGTVVGHRPWQDGKLAYEVDGHRKGLHYLAYFKMPSEGVKDVNRACKLSEFVIRHLIIKQPQSLFDAMVAALEGHDSTAPPPDEPPPRRDRERERERDVANDE
jgi:small subunit ribosomal protein S6